MSTTSPIASTASAFWSSIVRTFVPIIVGAVVAFLVSAGINLDGQFEVLLTTLLTGVFTAIYYLLVRIFEVYVSPKFGWLLGLAKPPAYAGTAGTGEPVLITNLSALASKDVVLAEHALLDPTEKLASEAAAVSRVNP
ncbi:hypothetical protein [Glaciihabitans sp. UYNi722]|uniref:hypothetical protein n=1 Tax=Glaciihabitans sp. UYNi722 TaxID=3156344 RepID=UPI003393B62B